MGRTPFPVPFGWYQICWPDELEPGGVLPLYYFGRDLVLWRDSEDGAYHLQDAICPHLGGHLGHGGHVENCEIMCPFHGWKFDSQGRNSEIPYSERVNRAARLRTFPIVERNGMVLAWYHPFEEDPLWEIPDLEEFSDSENWSDTFCRTIEIDAAWQEVAENSVDIAHFRYVHNTDSVPEARGYETDGWIAHVRTSQKFVTPQGVVAGNIDIDNYGPGFSVIRFSGIVDTVLLGCNTPVSSDTCEQKFSFRVRRLGDDATTSSVGEAFVAEITQQIHEDLPIWKYKGHVAKPALADTDGPYIKFRKWASQFYAEGVEFDRDVYPPNPPGTSRPAVEGTVKHSASSRLKGEDQIRADMMSTN
ncbi:MAG TPA: Rieske 2Fe-2S domain-containing protein [Microthrixaceae bacterium]|nr:Rieske 2Fe-2S domain-containing protein [Microthrixaceae bacterium]HNI34560.1 Rieske 2Fe-2S domain-containing protein [Microthrixaceae bacterium]